MHRSAGSPSAPGLVCGGDVCEEFGPAFSYCGGTVGGVWKKPVVADDGGGSGGGDMFLTRGAPYIGASVNFLFAFSLCLSGVYCRYSKTKSCARFPCHVALHRSLTSSLGSFLDSPHFPLVLHNVLICAGHEFILLRCRNE